MFNSKKEKQDLSRSKIRKDKIAKWSVSAIAIFLSSLLLIIFAFILKEAIPSIKNHGFKSIFLSSNFNPNTGNFGIWGPLLITFITTTLAIMIAVPLAIRANIFLKYRLNKMNKVFRIFIEILAGIPSIIFGLFALTQLSHISKWLFHFNNPNSDGANVFTASLMLTFMILPILISFIFNYLNSIPKYYLDNTLALGNSKTYSIYHVVKQLLKPGVKTAIIVATGRAIGETMAVSLILSGSNLHQLHGFWSIFNSSLNTLGGNIAYYMGSDSGGSKSGLFAAGISLFVLIMFFNIIFTIKYIKKPLKLKLPVQYQEKKTETNNWRGIFKLGFLQTKHYLALPFHLLGHIIFYFKIGLKYLVHLLEHSLNWITAPRIKDHNIFKYMRIQAKYKYRHISDYLRLALEILCFGLIIGFVCWISLDILVGGIKAFINYGFSEPGHSDMASVLGTTILLIMISIFIAFPLALATAIYLNEFAVNKFVIKIIRFFISSLGGTPSILFGMFGMILFLQTFHLGHTWKAGSLLAGALTMTIVIIPMLTLAMEASLKTVPQELREASYALGAGKWETITKIVIPNSMNGIISGVLLSIGRILSETAPVYLTVGLIAHQMGIFDPGQTLTSRMLFYAIYSTFASKQALAYAYASALITYIFVLFITLLAHHYTNIYRLYKNIKDKCKIKFATQKDRSQKMQRKTIEGDLNVEQNN